MKRLSLLILVGLVTFAVVLLAKRPELLKEFSAWTLGLIPPVLVLGKFLWVKAQYYIQLFEAKYSTQKLEKE